MLFFALIMTAIMSLTMIGIGYIFIKKPPNKINSVIGYRTSMSSKNMDTWTFAHKYSGKVWLISGSINAIISSVIIFTFQNLKNYNQLMGVLIFIQILVLLLVVPLTELALRKVFDKKGNRIKR